MKNNFKRILGFILMIGAVAAVLTVASFAEVYEGDFYEGLSYHIDTKEGVLTISGEGTVLGILNDEDKIVGVGYGGAGLPWKDGDWAGEVKEVVITAPLTEAKGYMLSQLANCVKMTIPSTLTKIGGGLFAYDNNLNIVATDEGEAKEGVLDLRSFTGFGGYIFDGALSEVTPTVLLGKGLTGFEVIKMAQKCKGLNFKIFPGSVAETWLSDYAAGLIADEKNNICDNVTYEYYTLDELGDIPTSGESTLKGFAFTWTFDAETETLTFAAPEGVTGWNELGTKDASILADIAVWRSYVKHIVVASKFSKVQINNVASMFAGYPELLDIDFGANTGFTEIQSSGTTGLFEGNTKMNAIGFGTLTEGVADLSRIVKISGNGLAKLFKGCEAIESVIFKEGLLNHNVAPYSKIEASMFEGCTALESITVPAQMTEICSNAFAGCTALREILFLGAPLTIAEGATGMFPDNEGLVITTQTKEDAALINSLGLENAVAAKVIAPVANCGYSVRLEGYNGLRGVFSFDNTEIAELSKLGYSLVEYGAIVASAANKEAYGIELTKVKGDYVTADDSVLKTRVYGTGVFVNKILSTTTEDTVYYAISVINIPEEKMATELAMCGYAVLRDKNGAEFVVYSESCETSLRSLSIDMYKNGVVNFQNDTENIVFDAMMSGVVTLESGTDYTVVEGQTDLEGNPIGDTFKFENVPAVNQSVVDGVLTFTASDVTITLIEDGDEYVAVYQGSGTIPGASRWSDRTVSQLGSGFTKMFSGASFTSVSTAVPHPVLLNASKIKTAIICEGITELGVESFSQCSVDTIMYPESLTKICSAQFQSNPNISTVFRSGDVPEKGLIDLSYVTTVETGYLFNSVSNVKKLHLPASITSCGTQMFASMASLTGVWCGDGEYTEGVIDLSNSAVKTLKDRVFTNVTNINTVKLPDTIETISSDTGDRATFYGANGAGVEGSDAKITVTTPTANEAMNSYAQKFTYVNYVSDAESAA